MNTEVRKNTKSDFEKDIFELMNNAVFRNSMKNVINHSVILSLQQPNQEQTAGVRTKLSYSIKKFRLNYHTKKMLMNKPVFLGLAILEITKIVAYEF